MIARELNVIRAEFKALHVEAARLLKETLRVRSTLRLMLRRRPLLVLEGRLDDLFERFVTLDAEFVEHTTAPQDINSATLLAAHLSVYRALRDSVSGLLTDTSDALGALRSRLDTSCCDCRNKELRQPLGDSAEELFENCRTHRLREVTIESCLARLAPIFILTPAGDRRDVDMFEIRLGA
jgi:hypothetical protein